MEPMQMILFGMILGILCIGVAIGWALNKRALREMQKVLIREQMTATELEIKLSVAHGFGYYISDRAYKAESRHSRTGDYGEWLEDAHKAWRETSDFQTAKAAIIAEANKR